jgi:hypothetical protein
MNIAAIKKLNSDGTSQPTTAKLAPAISCKCGHLLPTPDKPASLAPPPTLINLPAKTMYPTCIRASMIPHRQNSWRKRRTHITILDTVLLYVWRRLRASGDYSLLPYNVHYENYVYVKDIFFFYEDMKKDFQGHQGTDFLRLILILMAFKINSSLFIQEDVARLHKNFQDLDYALGHEFEVEVNLAIFLAQLQFDKRPGVVHYIGNLKFIKVARIGIEDITSPVTIGANSNTHSMIALSAVSIQYCHKFAAGTCTQGAQCKYVHKIDKSAPAKPSIRQGTSVQAPLQDCMAQAHLGGASD